MSQPPRQLAPAARISIVRTAIAAVLVVAGIAWVTAYQLILDDPAQLTWMQQLGRWNYLIGFGMIMLGLVVSAHPSTPLGRGRGVVVGMLGCFLLGLVWIIVYYFTSNNPDIPLLGDLAALNLVVGISFMAVGFVFATKWE